MNKEAKHWKANLVDGVQLALLAKGIAAPGPPVHGLVGGTFVDRGIAPDLHNLSELVCDAVQKGTGINDKHFTFATEESVFAKVIPEIRVSVSATVESERGMVRAALAEGE
jgi:hypothetical protein